MTTALAARLDALEAFAGPPPPVPATDGWGLVLLENVAYLVDDTTRVTAFRRLRERVGLDPEAILAAPMVRLEQVVAGIRPGERAERLRRCAELRLAGAPWRDFPGIGRPGLERIELFTGARPVLALESNAVRVLFRLGYGQPRRGYDALHRSVQGAAAAELPPDGPTLVRAHQLLRRHGQTVCRRTAPACPPARYAPDARPRPATGRSATQAAPPCEKAGPRPR